MHHATATCYLLIRRSRVLLDEDGLQIGSWTDSTTTQEKQPRQRLVLPGIIKPLVAYPFSQKGRTP